MTKKTRKPMTPTSRKVLEESLKEAGGFNPFRDDVGRFASGGSGGGSLANFDLGGPKLQGSAGGKVSADTQKALDRLPAGHGAKIKAAYEKGDDAALEKHLAAAQLANPGAASTARALLGKSMPIGGKEVSTVPDKPASSARGSAGPSSSHEGITVRDASGKFHVELSASQADSMAMARSLPKLSKKPTLPFGESMDAHHAQRLVGNRGAVSTGSTPGTLRASFSTGADAKASISALKKAMPSLKDV